jgi:murein DD-endopeptidase MepM/ murein hydrolase activator NlpD
LNTNATVRVAALTAARGRKLRLAGVLGMTTVLVAISLVASDSPAAYAKSYPSWSDVVAARHNEAAKKAVVNQIRGLISGLDSKLKSAQADATAKGAIAYAAEEKYDTAETKQQTLQAQVDAATKKAAKSRKEVAEYVAQLARGADGSDGTTLNLLLNGKTASQLLDNLGAINQVSERENAVYKEALSDQNAAKQLRALAAQQAGILKTEKKAADDAEAAAVTAATNLQTAVTAQQAHEKALELELAALTTKAKMTSSQYEAGVRASAAAYGAGEAGVVDSQGWALPTVGVITSPWGYRNDPAAGYTWRMHYGDDIAHGCLQPIYAAHSGTVTYAGPYGDIGNYIMIKNDGADGTAYGHIANGETFVHVGQRVSTGQNIARTGSTGFSTGCHLYFQVMVNGNPVNPAPFMQARGVILGRG